MSNAYPAGYVAPYQLVEGGYCLTIAGAPASRVLQRQGGGSAEQIPFDFYNDTHKISDPNRPQDFKTPIGDGTWGIAFFDWDYREGDLDRAKYPAQGKTYYPIPVVGQFKVHLHALPSGMGYPPGIYANNFTFNWVAGAVQYAGTYPRVTEGSGICNRWTGQRGSGTVRVQLEIKKYCTIATMRDINFGRQAFLNKVLTAEGQIAVACSAGTQFGVAINDGLHSENGQRAMKRDNGDDKIIYNLFQDAALTQPWKSGWSGGQILRGTGQMQNQPFSVYSAVSPQGNKPAGLYKDTLIVEVHIIDAGD